MSRRCPCARSAYGYDKATTSQAEADRNRGREMRKQEKREAKEQRRAAEEARQRNASPQPY